MILKFSIAASVILPGLGHLFQKKVRKGLLVSVSYIVLVLLLIWRIKVFLSFANLKVADLGFFAEYREAFARHPWFLLIVTGGLLAIWILSLIDLFRLNDGRKELLSIFAVILFSFFVMGSQISEINVSKMIANISDTFPKIGRILWPWKAVVEDVEVDVAASANILVDDDVNPPPVPEVIDGKPYLLSTPTYGRLSQQTIEGIVMGDVIHLKGSGYDPDVLVEIWWKDSVGNAFRPRQDNSYTSVMADANGEFSFDLIMPYRMIPPSAKGQQIHKVIAKQVFKTGVTLSQKFITIVEKIVETVFMGMIATLFGIIFAIPVSFLAARNLMSGSRLSITVYYIVRTILNVIRSIEPLIWGLIAVTWVGLGPFAGVIALTIHSVAALGKLYSESIENIDAGQIEAIQATGATKLQTIMYGVIPQMIPPFVSFTIYRWDINVRMSTIIGMVGGGGIGFILQQHIKLLDYEAAGIAMVMIAIIVSILDYVSSRIRQKFI